MIRQAVCLVGASPGYLVRCSEPSKPDVDRSALIGRCHMRRPPEGRVESAAAPSMRRPRPTEPPKGRSEPVRGAPMRARGGDRVALDTEAATTGRRAGQLEDTTRPPERPTRGGRPPARHKLRLHRSRQRCRLDHATSAISPSGPFVSLCSRCQRQSRSAENCALHIVQSVRLFTACRIPSNSY